MKVRYGSVLACQHALCCLQCKHACVSVCVCMPYVCACTCRAGRRKVCGRRRGAQTDMRRVVRVRVQLVCAGAPVSVRVQLVPCCPSIRTDASRHVCSCACRSGSPTFSECNGLWHDEGVRTEMRMQGCGNGLGSYGAGGLGDSSRTGAALAAGGWHMLTCAQTHTHMLTCARNNTQVHMHACSRPPPQRGRRRFPARCRDPSQRQRDGTPMQQKCGALCA